MVVVVAKFLGSNLVIGHFFSLLTMEEKTTLTKRGWDWDSKEHVLYSLG